MGLKIVKHFVRMISNLGVKCLLNLLLAIGVLCAHVSCGEAVVPANPNRAGVLIYSMATTNLLLESYTRGASNEAIVDSVFLRYCVSVHSRGVPNPPNVVVRVGRESLAKMQNHYVPSFDQLTELTEGLEIWDGQDSFKKDWNRFLAVDVNTKIKSRRVISETFSKKDVEDGQRLFGVILGRIEKSFEGIVVTKEFREYIVWLGYRIHTFTSQGILPRNEVLFQSARNYWMAEFEESDMYKRYGGDEEASPYYINSSTRRKWSEYVGEFGGMSNEVE